MSNAGKPPTLVIRHPAGDPQAGMTLDELAAFVQQAMRYEMPGTEVVRVGIGWRSQIQWLQVPR